MTDYLPPVVAKLTGDHGGLVTTLREGKEKVKAWAVEVGKTKATISVEAKLKDGTLAALRTKVKDSAAAKLSVELSLKTGTLTTLRDKVKGSAAAKLEVSATLKAGSLATLRTEISESAAAKLDTALRLKDGTLAAIRQKVKDSTAAKLDVQLKLDSVQAGLIRADLEATEVELKVKPKIDQVAQRRVAIILAELGKRVDVLVRPTVNSDDALRTQLRLDRIARDRTSTIRTRVIGPTGGSGSASSGGSGALKALLPLATALVPVAASLTASTLSLAAAWGSSAVAAGVFGAAVIPQILMFKDLTDAQSKASKANDKYGAMSKQAAQAQAAQVSALDAMTPATRQAAGSYLILRSTFTGWSDKVSAFTMRPVEQGIESVNALIPKTTPLVKSFSGQFERLTTMLGGEINSPGFDGLMKRFTTFADGALKRGVDDITHFSRLMSEGRADGPFSKFMDYAREQGPAVRETLKNIALAVVQVTKGAAEAGPGILTLVNAAAKLVASLPPRFIATVMQLYTAFKLVGLAKAGVMAVSTGVGSLTTRLTAMRVASLGAGGGLAGVRAALATLSTGTKVAGAIAVVAGVVMVMQKLSDGGKKAPDVDRMTTAVGNFARTGKASGEITRVFGTDMDGLGKAIDRVSGKRSGMDAFNDTMNKILTLGMKESNSKRDAKKQIDAIDQSLASLVTSGHAQLAAQAIAEFAKTGNELPTDKLDAYKSALADAAFESRLVADSQGLFGDQAVAVQKKLDAQKQSADGLRQAIQDLNDVNRAALSAESDFEQAIDDAAKAIKGHRNALKMVHGQLDLNSQAARDAYKPLTDLAAATDADAAAAREQGKSWDTVYGIYDRGRSKIIATADAMGLNRQQAKALADQILKQPASKSTMLKGDLSDLQAKLKQQKAALAKAPKGQTAAIKGNIAQLLAQIRSAQRALAGLHDKTVGINIVTTHTTSGSAYHEGGGYATGAITSGGIRKMAAGGFGRPAMMAKGGANILWGEGPDESYIPHTRTPRSRRIATETVGILGGRVSWGGSGGSTAGTAAPLGAQVAKGLWAGMSGQAGWLAAQARRFAIQTIPEPMAEALGIKSPSKVAMALGRWVGYGLVQGLTGSTASVKAAALRLSRSIEQVFHDDAKAQLAADTKRLASLAHTKGKKAASERADIRKDMAQQQSILNKDSAISKFVAADNKRLLVLAGQRDQVVGKLKAAQAKLAALQKSWTDEKNSVAAGIMQGTSIVTQAPQEGFTLTGQDVVQNMRDQVAKATQFAVQLQALKKKGLSATLIEQLATAGVDQGGSTAAALAGASQSTIDQVNSLQKNLQTTANTTGSTVADAMYGAGIKSAQGLVKGLQSQEKAIEKQMLKIALSMQAAIKKALGIKSPSAVMARLGDYTAQGVAVGINRSAKHAVIAAQGLAMAVQQSASITGGLAAGGRGGAAGAGMTVVNHYHAEVTVQGSVTTERRLIDAVTTGMQKVATRNPTTYPSYKR